MTLNLVLLYVFHRRNNDDYTVYKRKLKSDRLAMHEIR
jgi:hypothetical protein